MKHQAWRIRAIRADGTRLEIENDGEFDELVLGDWLHVEEMDDGRWWMRVGENHIFVTFDESGRAVVEIDQDNGAGGDKPSAKQE